MRNLWGLMGILNVMVVACERPQPSEESKSKQVEGHYEYGESENSHQKRRVVQSENETNSGEEPLADESNVDHQSDVAEETQTSESTNSEPSIEDPSPSPSPSQAIETSRWASAYAGRFMSGFLTAEGMLYVSGGHNPSLGVVSDVVCFSITQLRCQAKPVLLTDKAKFLDVVLPVESIGHALAVGVDGFAYAWGSNLYGEVNLDLTLKPTLPTKVEGPVNITSVALNRNYSMALDKDGVVWEWGGDWMRINLGTIASEKRIAPRKVTGLPPADKIRGFGGASFAVAKDGRLFHWGQLSARRVLYVEVIDRIPKAIAGLSEITDFKASNQFLALTKTGQVYSWGYGGLGALGLGDLADRAMPLKIEGLNDVIEIFTQEDTSYAVTKSGSTYMWGLYRNSFPKVDGAVDCGFNRKCLLKPTLVPELPPLQKLSCSFLHCIGYSASSKQWVGFGNRYMGLMGDGSYIDQIVGITKLGEL
jgi:alpha-tubulin suppressor-like RCC1 family protein